MALDPFKQGTHTESPVAMFSYDAFISYSHQDDGKLAPALQAGLERFAKPWYRLRALRVFLDTASLSADPRLWGSVEEALGSSRWLVLLASPNATKSEWVNREVAWWLEHRSSERLLVVATSPGLAWDEQLNDWSAGSLVPPALRGAFAEEPRWVNLAEVRRDDRRLVIPAELIADIAAPVLGRPKDEVIGDQLREHRRTMRLARGVVGTLAVLTAAATIATFLAIGQRNDARTQARVATSREIAALAIATLSTDTDVAQLLAVAAYKTDRNPQTQGALFEAVTASPQLVRYLQTGSAVTCLAAAADGKVVAAGTTDGKLVLFDLATGARRAVQAGHDPVTDVALSADGSRVAAADGSQAVAWAAEPGRQVMRFGMSSGASSVAVSPSGRLVAVLSNSNRSAGIFNSDNATASLVVRDMQTGRQVDAAEPWWVTQIGFSDNSSLMLLGEGGSWKQVTAPGLREVAQHRGGLTPNVGTFGTSPDALFRVSSLAEMSSPGGLPGRRAYSTRPRPDRLRDCWTRTHGKRMARIRAHQPVGRPRMPTVTFKSGTTWTGSLRGPGAHIRGQPSNVGATARTCRSVHNHALRKLAHIGRWERPDVG